MRKHRAKPIVVIGFAFSAMVASVLSTVPAQAQMLVPAQSAATTTTHPVLFGGTTPMVPVQPKVGHLGIVRTYYNLGRQFVGPLISDTMGHGSSMLISLDIPPSSGPSYASIAAGQHDAEIRSFFSQVESTAVRDHIPAVYVSFEHEANAPAHAALGTPAQFVAAYRHIHNLAAAAHFNWNTGGHLHWVLILEHMAYFTAAQRPHWSLSMGFAANYFPGAGYVDYLAADGYNAGSCGSSRNPHFLQPGSEMVTPGSMFDPLLAFAQQHGNLPALIAEWASIAYTNSSLRPKYIRSMQSYVLDHPQIKGVSYWDSTGAGSRGKGGGPSSVACNFSVNNDAASLTALNAMNRALQHEATTTGKNPHHTSTMHPTPHHHRTRPMSGGSSSTEAISQGMQVVSRMLAAGK